MPNLLARKFHSLLRVACWKILAPEIALACGSASVQSDSDWEVANEIFIRREYDDSILQALSSHRDGPVRILDLGANVGFFSLRCLHLFAETSPTKQLELLAIEGSRNVYEQLVRRVPASSPNVRLTLKNGLVGERTGKAMFHSSLTSSCTNSVSLDGNVSANPLRNSYAEETEYLDIEKLLPADQQIDLIKCDIEGSELAFLKNYPALLKRTRRMVIELHPRECDTAACRDLLQSAGFMRDCVIKDHPTHSLELYSSQ